VQLNLNIERVRLDQLQEAVRANQVSFPSQVPVFVRQGHGQLQCHVVLLYFVMGWSCDKIAKRCRFTRQHIWQILNEWRRHAVALGYLQVIPPLEVMSPLRPSLAAQVPLAARGTVVPRMARVPVPVSPAVPVSV
jgi:hypothetical protein